MTYEIGTWTPLAESRQLPAVCGIYLIRHIESGKEYVGKSVNILSRLDAHRSAIRRKPAGYLHRAVRKHGEAAFEVCVYMLGAEAEVTELEVLLIEERGTFNPAGYNQTLGGDGASGFKATPEQREKMSLARKGVPLAEETKRKMREAAMTNNPFAGKKHSLESRVRISETLRLRGSAISPETRKKMADGKRGKKLPPHTELTKLKLSLLKRGVPKPEGFADKHLKGENNPMYGRRGAKSPLAKPVAVWLPDSMTPIIFDTLTEAAAWMGCNPASISDWCSDRYRPKNGYSWARL